MYSYTEINPSKNRLLSPNGMGWLYYILTLKLNKSEV